MLGPSIILPSFYESFCRKRVVQHRLEPDELTTKHLAMLGSAVLILAHSVRDRYATSNTVAGAATLFHEKLVVEDKTLKGAGVLNLKVGNVSEEGEVGGLHPFRPSYD